MRSRRHPVSSKKTLLIVLLALSFVGLLLPPEWTGGLVSLIQIIVPFQDAATAAGDAVRETLERDAPAVPAEAYETIQRAKAAREHQIAVLTARVRELEEEVELLTATRLWGGRDRRLGARGRLIPARVVGHDIVTWRSSRLINAGSLQGVRPGAVVTSRLFNIDQGEAAGVRNGLAILLGETFVGTVEQATGSHTARFKLLSDVSVQMKVRIGRLSDESFTPLDGYFWLRGRGRGVMEIGDVDRRDVRNDVIRVGDLVLADHTGNDLPAPMVIGKISAIRPDRDNPLLSILTVKSSVDHQSLRRVYVFDPQTATDDEAVPTP